jgi:hypothetical protein
VGPRSGFGKDEVPRTPGHMSRQLSLRWLLRLYWLYWVGQMSIAEARSISVVAGWLAGYNRRHHRQERFRRLAVARPHRSPPPVRPPFRCLVHAVRPTPEIPCAPGCRRRTGGTGPVMRVCAPRPVRFSGFLPEWVAADRPQREIELSTGVSGERRKPLEKWRDKSETFSSKCLKRAYQKRA